MSFSNFLKCQRFLIIIRESYSENPVFRCNYMVAGIERLLHNPNIEHSDGLKIRVSTGFKQSLPPFSLLVLSHWMHFDESPNRRHYSYRWNNIREYESLEVDRRTPSSPGSYLKVWLMASRSWLCLKGGRWGQHVPLCRGDTYLGASKHVPRTQS